MKKLKLRLDALKVESFGTTAARIEDAGTVRAHAGGMLDEEEAEAITSRPKTNDASCLNSCYASCWGTCSASCNGTCAWSCEPGCTDTCATGGAICCA
jgi:modification target Cys-rich repeat protein